MVILLSSLRLVSVLLGKRVKIATCVGNDDKPASPNRPFWVGDSSGTENIGKPPIKKGNVENSRKTAILDYYEMPSFLSRRNSKMI